MIAYSRGRMGIYANLRTVDTFNQQKAFFEKRTFCFSRITDIRLEHANLNRGFSLFAGRHLLDNQVTAALAEVDDILQAGLDSFLEQVLESISRKFIDTAIPAHRRVAVPHDNSKGEVVVFFLIVRNTWQNFNNSINNRFLHFWKLSQKEFLDLFSIEPNNARRIVSFGTHKNPIYFLLLIYIAVRGFW